MPTIDDVARLARVSRSTVSHALSGNRPISKEVKERIFQVMEELDYRPKGLAQALKTKQTRIIALLFPSLRKDLSQLQLEFVNSALESASEQNYSLLLSILPIEEQKIMHFIEQGFVDGVVLMGVKLHDARVELLRKRKYPFSMIGHCEDNTGLFFVDLDFEAALYDCVKYLASLGHQYIGFLNEAQTLLDLEFGPAIRANAGFQKAIKEFNLHGLSYPCQQDANAGYSLMRQLLTEEPRLSAVITINPWVIGGVTQAANECGLTIPEDLSHISVVSPRYAEMLSPALTAIDLPSAEMGRIGVELLIRQLEDKKLEPVQQLLTPNLTVRASTLPYLDRKV
ncbi:MAG TPA: LacI family DNA-binding transcriptional regulator [Chloroflexia bacterium]|nr:LacI family DNA-binding transcriptional regulator [Chloroflexia bacterium]